MVTAPARHPIEDDTFYFVMPDRFANGSTANDTGGIPGDRLDHGFDPTDNGFFHGGDLAGLTEKLDYLTNLGISAIWMTPVFQNNPVQGSGVDISAGYHGYWYIDMTQFDPHFGTNAELETLINGRTAAASRFSSTLSPTTPPTSSTIRRGATAIATRPIIRTKMPTATFLTTAITPGRTASPHSMPRPVSLHPCL
ncbi:MAG: alpha-amylase family glycosyl hydrolase [Caldilineaceae bacterium]